MPTQTFTHKKGRMELTIHAIPEDADCYMIIRQSVSMHVRACVRACACMRAHTFL